MKILILGANGHIGNYLSNYLKAEHEIIPLSKNDLDIREKDSVINMINSFSPDIVVQAAGISNIDYCEDHETESYSVNTLGTLNVAYACNSLDIPIVYISSGYVYGDSKETPYYETDKCNPINVYGKSKLAGEKLIRTICKKYFIIRTSWCFGGSKCYIKKILDNINSPIFLTSDNVINPTYIEDLAQCISQIIHSDFYGVYNCVNTGYVSKRDVVQFIFEYLRSKKDIYPIPCNLTASLAPRPNFSAMDTKLIYNCFGVTMPTWQDSLTRYLNSIVVFKN